MKLVAFACACINKTEITKIIIASGDHMAEAAVDAIKSIYPEIDARVAA
jgi:hypothetical protein